MLSRSPRRLRSKSASFGGFEVRGFPELDAGRIAAARRVQLERGSRLNARVDGRHLRGVVRLGPSAERRLVELAETASLSARGTTRLLRVARTIADLAGVRAVDAAHLEEAARFRLPGSGWPAVESMNDSGARGKGGPAVGAERFGRRMRRDERR